MAEPLPDPPSGDVLVAATRGLCASCTAPESSAASSSEETRDDGATTSDDAASWASGQAPTEETSEPGSEDGGGHGLLRPSTARTVDDLRELFSENIVAKMCRLAVDALRGDALLDDRDTPRPSGAAAAASSSSSGAEGTRPTAFPEYCPQEGDHAGRYVLRDGEFWTCGFFPGTLYALLERAVRFPQSLGLGEGGGGGTPSATQVRDHLASLCRVWSEPLHDMAGRTDTHDIGFIVMPALRMDWELTCHARSLASIVRAARSLATRYVPTAGAIRSWDLLRKRDVEIAGLDDNLLLIVDSLCNLDLLYYAAAHSGDTRLADVATAHARTLLTTHLRREAPAQKGGYAGPLYSTCHVANLDPRTGEVKRRLTAQGYADGSTWARGQAWAILGYAQAYAWTRHAEFLDAACGTAEYFLRRLAETAGSPSWRGDDDDDDDDDDGRTVGRMVPPWDFDAPIEEEDDDGRRAHPPRDSSAGVIAANGMLVLSQALAGAGRAALATRFRDAAVEMVRDTLDFALAREEVRFVSVADGGGGGGDALLATEDAGSSSSSSSRFDALLRCGTANNNANARKRYANHGLAYGDYYLVEFGNRLLRMGLA